MRKITKQAVQAFLNGKNYKCGNTEVRVLNDKENPNVSVTVILSLHNNDIAEIEDFNRKRIMRITNCGWFTNTTKERLNGLPGVSILQKKGEWFLNGKEWDGDWITI